MLQDRKRARRYYIRRSCIWAFSSLHMVIKFMSEMIGTKHMVSWADGERPRKVHIEGTACTTVDTA